MRKLLLGATICLVATSAGAQPRASSVAMSCGQARNVVASSGAIVLGTGGHTYDRFVADRRFCLYSEVTEPAWVPTADTRQCFIGYRCKEASFLDR
jgi:hypothetical protein